MKRIILIELILVLNIEEDGWSCNLWVGLKLERVWNILLIINWLFLFVEIVFDDVKFMSLFVDRFLKIFFSVLCFVLLFIDSGI